MKRLENVQACIEDVLAQDVPGDLIETGVWRGGTSIFMRAVLKAHGDHRPARVRGGLLRGPAAAGRRAVPAPMRTRSCTSWSSSSVSLETVQDHFRRLGLLDDQVRFVKGWFRDTMPTLTGEQWSVIRLDGDLYESTINVLENLYPNLSPGGYVIVDDYNSLLVLPQGGDRLPRGARHHRRDPRDRLDRRLLAQGRRRLGGVGLGAPRAGPRSRAGWRPAAG